LLSLSPKFRGRLGDNNDQSSDRAAPDTAHNGVTSPQVIEFTRALRDTMISRVTSKKSPHTFGGFGAG
jgi:hypothetical protein